MVTWKKLKAEKLLSSNRIKLMDDIVEQSLRQTIKKYGVMKNLVVIEEGDKYRIIDGTRIFRAATIEGVKEFVCSVIDTQDETYLRFMLNTINHKNDLVKLAEMIQTLSELQVSQLPYNQKVIDTLKTLQEFDWNQYHNKEHENQNTLF